MIRNIGIDVYIGEEAGEVAEYQFLNILCALHSQKWPKNVDIVTGNIIDEKSVINETNQRLYINYKWFESETL